MRSLFTYFVLLFVLSVITISAQDTFERSYEIPVPVIENTGFGEFISGVDFDGDGNPEIYAVNNMLDQGGAELIPRAYKFEFNGTSWDSVWSATITNIPQQNSWAALTWGDWDQDGKPEIVWGPANNLSGENTNPPRILVFEYPGDGSDNMGVDIFGNFSPNAQWTITPDDNKELRPFRWELTDIDSDGDIELCFASRQINYKYGVVSVSDIPDMGDGSETWTLETSGLDYPDLDPSTFYDMVVIDNTMYLFHSNGNVTLVSYEDGAYSAPSTFEGMVPGGSWKSAQAVDIDGNGSKEIAVGGWASASDSKLYILEPDDFEVLKSTTVADLTSLIGDGGRFNGGAFGDIDQDGNMDIVFGTRQATPNGAIVRIEYQGGSITDSASYTYSIIDSLLSETSTQRFDVADIANVDDDPELEVLYTDGNQTGRIPIAILDIQPATSVAEETVPTEFYLGQNYPNPFNPTTTIKFGLQKEAQVNLKVYDILGREVATLIDSQIKPAGVYTVPFNASSLASGTYIYTLKAGTFLQTKKMLLIK